MVISCIVGFAIPIILFISERRSRREMIFVELIFGVVSIIVALFSRKIYVEES